MYDVIVVGARCAGSPTAMLLARKGHLVLLVDRANFPSDTLSTHFIRPSGVAQLKRWGLLERVIASGCPPISRFKLDWGQHSLVGTPPPRDGVAESYAPRRTVLDKLLVDAAVASGAELREGFATHDLLWKCDRVTGIRGQTRHGSRCDSQSSLSRPANQAGAERSSFTHHKRETGWLRARRAAAAAPSSC